jgi:hypothetical protein
MFCENEWKPCSPLFRWQSSEFIFLRIIFLLYSLPAPSQSILSILFLSMLAISALRLCRKGKLNLAHVPPKKSK